MSDLDVGSGSEGEIGTPESSEERIEVGEKAAEKKVEEEEEEGGDVGDDVEEEESEEEEEPIHYESKDLISKPYLSANSTFREDSIRFHHSFGYDCLKLYNLCPVDYNNVAFISGNYIHFFNIGTFEFRLRRSAGGGGLGFITKHPSEPLIAVGEKGVNPLIIIYEWPTFDVASVLHNGTKKEYTFLNFSPDGEMLSSLGGFPDYMLTVWNWKKCRTILRCKAHGQDIFQAQFSPSIPGQLTSCGIGHIKFWNMSDTFTGKKLQGVVGRFGKTMICDITTVFPMPDEKVISDCAWGNILIWDAGLIKLEVCRRKREPCHEAPITWIEYNAKQDELLTVGLDGRFRVWNYTKIDRADPPDDDRVIQMQTSYDYEIKDKEGVAAIRTLFRRNPTQDPFHFLAQDTNGFIWLLDLEIKPKPEKPVRLYRCHAGPIADMAASPCDYYIATLGVDGNLHVYNVTKKCFCLHRKFPLGGSSLLWLPVQADRTGSVLLAGFCDGTVRVVVVSIRAREQAPTDTSLSFATVIYALKPHTNSVTVLTINETATIVVSGSSDGSIFAHQIVPFREYVKLSPLCLVELPGPVSSIIWKKTKETPIVLVTCLNGYTAECEVLSTPEEEPVMSYNFNLPIKISQFRSVKSETQRAELELKIRIRKEAKVVRKKAELQKIYAENPGVIINEELYLEDSEEEEELPPLFYPSEPSPLYFARYIDEDHFWVSAGAYDVGYIYIYEIGKNSPDKAIPIADASSTELMSCCELFDGDYLILGLDGGRIRIVRANPDDFTDFSDYWEFPMHDPSKGRISKTVLSCDSRMFFTTGEDASIFSYYVNIPDGKYKEKKLLPPILPPPEFGIDGYIAPDALSLEGIKKQIVAEKEHAFAEKKKDEMRAEINSVRTMFKQMMDINESLPDVYKRPRRSFILHPEVRASIEKRVQDKRDLLRRKTEYMAFKARLAYEKLYNYFIKPVKVFYFIQYGIRIKDTISSFSTVKVPEEFLKAEEEVAIYLEDAARKGRIGKSSGEKPRRQKRKKLEDKGLFIRGINEVLPLLTPGERMEFEKFEERERRRIKRLREWQAHMDSKPPKNLTETVINEAINEMKSAEADFKLKSSPDYKVPRSQRVTKQQKYNELLITQRKIWSVKDNFNDRLLQLRQSKVDMVVAMKAMRVELKSIHREIGQKFAKPFPEIPSFNMTREFPERIFETNPEEFPPDKPVPKRGLDKEFIMLYGRKPMDPNKIAPTAASATEIAAMVLADAEDQLPTAWSEELTHFRIIRLKERQERILYDVNYMIEKYDKELLNLKEEKLKCQLEIALLESHLLVLQQELEVIRGYQSLLERSQLKVDKNLAEKHINILRVNIREKKILDKEDEIERCNNHIKEIQNEFTEVVAETKYVKHLTKIFKKKYKPPKTTTDEDESESSSSEESSSTESEEGSEDEAQEMGAFQYDETICPDDLNPHIFQKVFVLRAERHKEELRIAAIRRDIYTLQRQIEIIRRKLKIIEVVITFQREEMEGFMKQQQEKLNQIEILVILKASQLQHYNKETKNYVHVDNCVLFQADELNKLYHRKDAFREEIELFKEGQRKCELHLQSIKKEIAFMNKEINKIQNEIKDEMKRKFGMVMDMRAMDIDIIRQMLVKRLYANQTEVQKKMKEIDALKKKEEEASLQITSAKRKNTTRFYTAAGLQEQASNFSAFVRDQEKILAREKEAEARHIPDDQLRDDLNHLTMILKDQERIKQELLSKIASLKTKTGPKYPAPTEGAEDAQYIQGKEITEKIPAEKKDEPGEEKVCKELMLSEVKTPPMTPDQLTTDFVESEGMAESICKEVMMSVISGVLPTPEESQGHLYTGEGEEDHDVQAYEEMGEMEDFEVMEDFGGMEVMGEMEDLEGMEVMGEMEDFGDMGEIGDMEQMETQELLEDEIEKESKEMTAEIFQEIIEDTVKQLTPSEEATIPTDEEAITEPTDQPEETSPTEDQDAIPLEEQEAMPHSEEPEVAQLDDDNPAATDGEEIKSEHEDEP